MADAVVVNVHKQESSGSDGSAGNNRGMPIAIKNLTYSVVSNKDAKVKINLLKDVSAAFEHGKMSALMGASGSGKTTLLDVLAGRKTTGETQGLVLYSAQKASLNFLRRFTAYVEQFDTMLAILTVKEMLMYTAELKRPHTESYAEKEAVVDYFIGRLALDGCKDTKIGNSMNKGISGGQAKRTSIAMAMVTSPRVLFLDEPTSGLDSFTSNETMTLVKHLAVTEGITIVATIHSPSPYTFNLFDSLLMLLRGEVVYFGNNDVAMVEYFQGGCGIKPKTSELTDGNLNTAEFLTDLIVGADRRNEGGIYADAYRNSALKVQSDKLVDGLLKVDSLLVTDATKKALETKRATVTPSWWGLKTIIKYRTLRNYRDPEFLGPRIGDKVVFSLLIMGLYWGIGNDFSADNLYNIMAMLFMWTTLPAFGAASYVPSIVLERPLFLRERSDGLYRVITYLVAKVLDEVMLAVPASVVFAAIVFYPLQLQGQFVIFWLIYLQVLTIGIMLAYLIASLSPNMDVANAALPTYVVTLLFFAGLLMRYDAMPVYLAWYSRINPLRYAWGGLMVNQFSDADPKFAGTDRTLLETYGLDNVGYSENMGIMLAFFVFFFVCTWATLAFKKYSSR